MSAIDYTNTAQQQPHLPFIAKVLVKVMARNIARRVKRRTLILAMSFISGNNDIRARAHRPNRDEVMGRMASKPSE
jgi:hypothetical protein